MAHDLRVRLLLTCGGVSLAAVLLLGGVFTAVLSSSVRSAHLRDLRVETSSLAGQIDDALRSGARRQAIQRLIRHDSTLLGKRIILLDRAGRPRFDSARWTRFSRGSWRMVDLSAAQHGHWARLQARDRLGLQSPLQVGGRTVGAVALITTAADTGVPWPQLIRPLLVLLGVLSLVWLLAALVLAHSLSRPLRRISAGLSRARDGEFDRPVPVEGWQEARVLARRYNEMVAEVARGRRAQRDFLANAAHELKTPVALVAGFARSLIDGTAEREDAAGDAVAVIQRESAHLARIVDQLFALASLEADAGSLLYSPCLPADLLAGTLARFEVQADARGVTLEMQADPALPVCRWDSHQVASALSNLVGNALEHSGSTWIRAEVRRRGSMVVFEVADGGKGIAAGDLPHVFDRFYRGSGRRIDGHAGLGLALVREIAERHAGTIAVESGAESGTRFALTLPPEPPGALSRGASGGAWQETA